MEASSSISEKVILSLGRFLFLLPQETTTTIDKPKPLSAFKKLRLCIKSIYISILLCVNTAMMVFQRGSQETDFFSKTSVKLLNWNWYLTVLTWPFMYIYFVVKSEEFMDILHTLIHYKFRNFPKRKPTNGNNKEDKTIFQVPPTPPDVVDGSWSFSNFGGVLAALMITFSALLETITFDIQVNRNDYTIYNNGEKQRIISGNWFSEFLQKLYYSDYKHVAHFLPYNFYFMTVYYVTIKIASVGLSYGNLAVVIICGLLKEKFGRLSELISKEIEVYDDSCQETEVDENEDGSGFVMMAACRQSCSIPWQMFHREYSGLKKLTSRASSFLYPIMVANYLHSIANVIFAIFQWLEPHSGHKITSTKDSIYQYFHPLHFTFSFVLLTYFSAEVYTSARKIGEVISNHRKLPFSWQVYRFEKLINDEKNPPGIYLFGNFLITHNMFVSMMSMLCTSQIVLLQMDPSRF